MKHVIGSTIEGDRPVKIDLPKLVTSRMLIQASSGSGKSFLMRRILEQTFGHIQQIVIDVEGEFATLREKFDYVLGAKEGGETSVDPRAASLLATRLLELKASAILDIYELNEHDRVLFVKNFLDAMINSPRALWRPILIAVDEAHKFCPQSHEVESSEAIMALCSRGRKRGFCPILATQRLSKLHKDAAAECLNKFIGRTQLDVDVKRASDDLGFSSKTQRQELRHLHPGEFFAFGPAVSGDILKIKGGDVLTTHPKAGGRIRFVAPPPTKKIKALLPSLADLPTEAVEKEKTKRELERALAAATRQVKDLQKKVDHPPPVREIQIIKPGAAKLLDRSGTRIEKAAKTLSSAVTAMQDIALRLNLQPVAPPPTAADAEAQAETDVRMLLSLSVPKRILGVLKTFPNLDAKRLGALANVSPRRSTFRVAVSDLSRDGLIEIGGDRKAHVYSLTALGETAAKDIATPPGGALAIEYWRRRIGGGVVAELFDAILAAGARGISKEGIEKATQIDTNISTFRIAIAKLKNLELITGDSTGFYIKKEFL